MQCPTDTIDPVTRKPLTRWKEAQIRLKEMIEILAYIPFNTIVIEFLNRKDQIVLLRQGRTPHVFIQDAYSQIDAIFPREPTRYDTTPYLEKIQQTILRGQGKSIARYFFGDGVPNGGERAQREIVNILKHRQEPVSNPITFISCTDEDDQVEWMKDAEEVCPYCSESDDFKDEGLEVLKDQGAALPYTKGFHIICTLVAAMNPDDLDAMDESVPFTKNTLDTYWASNMRRQVIGITLIALLRHNVHVEYKDLPISLRRMFSGIIMTFCLLQGRRISLKCNISNSNWPEFIDTLGKRLELNCV
jgi:hypothetical protein